MIERVRLPRKLTKSVSGGMLAEAGRLHPVGSLNITMNLQPLHRVTMTLAENDLDLAMHDLVEVYNQNGSVGIYRVVKITKTLRKERKIELSHGLDVFSDATLARITDWSGTVGQFLQMIIDGQTQKIGGQFYWQLGRCDDSNTWEKDISYDNAMECLTDLAKTEEDYMFTFDQSTFPWTLNFVRRNATVLSEFRLRRNTESCSITLDDSDLCTRLYLSVTSSDDDDSGSYIDEGYYTYNDSAAQSLYGIVCKTAGVDQEDFSSQSELDAWADAYFSRHNQPNVQISIDGMELNRITGESYDEMHLGRMCQVALPDYGTTYTERIVSVQYPDALRKPSYVQVSLHNKRETAEDAFAEISSTASSAASTASSASRGISKAEAYWRKAFSDTVYGLYGYIEMTASHLEVEFEDWYNRLYGYMEMTASHFQTMFEDQYNQLFGYMEVTASHFETKFVDQKNQLYGYVEATASHWESELVDQSASLRTLVLQTASSWEAKIEGVTDEDGNVTAASIGVAINENGSNAFINADHIHLTGNTLLSGQLTVENGALKVLTALAVGNTTGKIVTINDGKINVPVTLQISSGAELLFVGSQTGERYSFTASNVGNILTNAEIANSVLSISRKNGNTAVSVGISGNSLVFTDENGATLSFSKATALEGAWNSGTLTVDAYQTNSGTRTRVGRYISAHELSLNGNGSSSFSVEMKTQDTGESAQTVRDSKYIYLHENVNGVSSTVVAGENADGTGSVGSISTRATYNAGKTAGNAEGQAEYKALVRSRFGSSSGGYYIEGYESNSGNSISGSDTTYKLGTSGEKESTKVQIQDSSGTRIANTAEYSVGSLYTDGYNAGNANRASQISGFMSTSDAATQTLSAGTKYKFQSQYKKADGTWANGGTIVLATPANSPGTATIDHQTALTGDNTRAQPQFYAKLDGTTKQTLYTRLYRKTYNSGDHCVNMYAKVGSAATDSDTLIARISTEATYTAGYDAGYSKGEDDAYTPSYTEITGGSVSWDSGSIAGRYNCGSITRPDSRSYVKFSVTCRGVTRLMYIVVN